MGFPSVGQSVPIFIFKIVGTSKVSVDRGLCKVFDDNMTPINIALGRGSDFPPKLDRMCQVLFQGLYIGTKMNVMLSKVSDVCQQENKK